MERIWVAKERSAYALGLRSVNQQVRMYYKSNTSIASGQPVHMHLAPGERCVQSPDGSTFLRETRSWSPSWKYCVKWFSEFDKRSVPDQKYWLRTSTRVFNFVKDYLWATRRVTRHGRRARTRWTRRPAGRHATSIDCVINLGAFHAAKCDGSSAGSTVRHSELVISQKNWPRSHYYASLATTGRNWSYCRGDCPMLRLTEDRNFEATSRLTWKRRNLLCTIFTVYSTRYITVMHNVRWNVSGWLIWVLHPTRHVGLTGHFGDKSVQCPAFALVLTTKLKKRRK